MAWSFLEREGPASSKPAGWTTSVDELRNRSWDIVAPDRACSLSVTWHLCWASSAVPMEGKEEGHPRAEKLKRTPLAAGREVS